MSNRIEPDELMVMLIKGAERYVFRYYDTPQMQAEVLRRIGSFAANKELSLTWRDAGRLARSVRAR
jgi:hypothetical protein